MLTVVID